MERLDRLVLLLAQVAEVALIGGLAMLVLGDLLVGLRFTDAPPLAALAGAGVTAAVAARQRYLVASASAAAVGVLALAGVDRGFDGPQVSLAAIVGLGILGASLARRGPGAISVALIAVASVAVLEQAIRPANGGARLTLAVLVTGGMIGCVAAGAYLRWIDFQRQRAAEEARTEERLDLARELHDLVAHYVTGIVVQAQAARVVAGDRPEVAAEALAAIERAGGDALAAMRRLVGSLRTDGDGQPGRDIDPPAGVVGLRELVARSNELGIPARLDASDELLRSLPADVAGSVHRIVQESLTNVRRHAVDATLVDVHIHRRGDSVEIAVRDDGAGAGRPAGTGGYGLVGMTERATALGGTLRAGPHPDGGWTVVARVPAASTR